MYFDPKNEIITDDWEITPTAITLDEKIGEGAFGTVYSATVDAIVIMKSKYGKQAGGTTGFNSDKDPKVAVKLLKGDQIFPYPCKTKFTRRTPGPLFWMNIWTS